MKTKKAIKIFVCVLTVIMMAVMFAACSSGGEAGNDYGNSDNGKGSGLGSSDVSANNTDRKIIFTYECNIYTENLSETVQKILDALQQYENAYTESYSSESDGKNYASAQYTLRIKSEDLDSFLADMKNTGEVRNERLTSTDVTKNYLDLAAEKSAKEAEMVLLKDLLSKATNLAESMTISQRIADVQKELNKINSSLANYDSLVELSTVTVYIYETTAAAADEPTFGQKLVDVLKNSGKAILTFFEYALYFLIYVLPFAVVIAGISIPVVKASKKKRKKYMEKQEAYRQVNFAQQNAAWQNFQQNIQSAPLQNQSATRPDFQAGAVKNPQNGENQQEKK